jgi:hypothetical protein
MFQSKYVNYILTGSNSEINGCITSEQKNCYRFQPLACVSLKFRDTVKKNKHRNNLDAAAVRRLQLYPITPDFKLICSQYSLTRLPETPTHNKVYCFIYWLNRQRHFILIVFVYEEEKRAHGIYFLPPSPAPYFPIVANSKAGVKFVKYFSLEKGSTDQNV